MNPYVDLGVSIFDADFTLNPQRSLADLYPREEVLGFSSEGMNFAFRHRDCQQIMSAPGVTRALESHANREREADYARRYPNRARHFSLSYLHHGVNLPFKVLITRLMNRIAGQASFARVEAIVAPLGAGVSLPDFVAAVSSLPLRMFLETCQLPYGEADLATLHRAGFDFLKALENFSDEALIARADQAIVTIDRYLAQRCPTLPADSPLGEFLREGRASGLAEDQLQANIAGNFIAALSNTIGISSAFILRTLVRQPDALRTLQARPALLRSDDVITELLRRDNHVKAMSRHAHEPLPVGRFTLRQGESIMLFFPGINGDPARWPDPQRLDFSRDFNNTSHLVFGGSVYSCIGRRLALALLKTIVAGFVGHLPHDARIDDGEIELDASWVAERIITRLPVHL